MCFQGGRLCAFREVDFGSLGFIQAENRVHVSDRQKTPKAILH